MCAWSTEIVDALEVFFEALGLAVEEVVLVERTLRSALGARPVVAHDDDDRVVGLAELVDEVEHPTDLCVGVLEEAGEHLHHPRVEAPLVGGARVP